MPVFAAGYDDFSAGITADLRGESERAVAALTSALAAPDLAPAYKPVAYRTRAHAYLQLERCHEASADLRAYEALKLPDDLVVVYKIWADFCLKDVTAAHRDIAALTKGKVDSGDLFEFSRLAWRFGLFDEAARSAGEAFAGADKEESTAAYILLWQALNAARAGNLDPAAIAASLAEMKLDAWPKPIFSLYTGKLSPQELQKEAESWSDAKDTAQRCEANFYLAEWYLARSDKASATPLLVAATQKCPIGYIERGAAESELKRLGVPVPKE